MLQQNMAPIKAPKYTHKDKGAVTEHWRYINSLRSILVCGSQHFPEARKLPKRIQHRAAAADRPMQHAALRYTTPAVSARFTASVRILLLECLDTNALVRTVLYVNARLLPLVQGHTILCERAYV